MMSSLSVNIVGASGYVGAELIRLVDSHPRFKLKNLYANSKAGMKVGELFPNLSFDLHDVEFLDMSSRHPELSPRHPELVEGSSEGSLSDCDILFLALPHTHSHEVVQSLPDNGPLVVDLSADFRFENPDTYEQWYHTSHSAHDKQSLFQYGLVEFYREPLKNARYIAAPGCYPTAAIIASKPFIDAGLCSSSHIIVDAASGVSGAGANANDTTIFANVDSNFRAYGVINHRHTPEISKELGVEVLFTPHLVPMMRGIVATCYIPCERELSNEDLREVLTKTYANESFIHVADEPPATKAVVGTNNAIVSAFYDNRTHHIVAISAIDNLVKGAAGQAVQAANVALDIDETTGLIATALYP